MMSGNRGRPAGVALCQHRRCFLFRAWLLVVHGLLCCKAFSPLLQRQRPPEQTETQKSAQAKLVANAKAQSDAAKAELLDYLETTVRPALQGTALSAYGSEELLDRMVWEFKRLPLIHNAPFNENDPAGIQDDTILETTISNAYLQNVCQRYALGVESPDNFKGEHGIMTFFLGLPNFAKDMDPTLREANDCVLYVANNLRKTAAGNFVYGSLTYAMNPNFADRLTVTPFDTGAYSHDHPVSFGTLDNFCHLVLPHVRVLNYNLAEVFKRWWIPSTPTPIIGKFPYFEVQWFGNAWMPESLLYVLAKFSNNGKGEGVWGTHVGKSLQAFLTMKNRPLLWADGDDSGILIDPTVGNIAGNAITAADVARFQQLWTTNPSWQDLYNGSPPYLRFSLLSYDQRAACSQQEQSQNNMIMGIDGAGACVYWVAPDLQPDRWECLNDGTCGKTYNTDRTYDSEQDCLQNCGAGKWACVTGLQGARADAHHCEPDMFGPCPDLGACEQHCGTPDGCAPSPPPPPPPPAPIPTWNPDTTCSGTSVWEAGTGLTTDQCEQEAWAGATAQVFCVVWSSQGGICFVLPNGELVRCNTKKCPAGTVYAKMEFLSAQGLSDRINNTNSAPVPRFVSI